MCSKLCAQETSPRLFFKIEIIEAIASLLQFIILAFGKISFINPIKKKLSRDLSVKI